MVFMQHGLALAMFQATAALLALTLCGRTEYRRVERIGVFLVLAVVTILTNSLGAIILFALGLGLWALCRGQAYGMVMVGTLLVVPLYPGARAFLNWDGHQIVSYFEKVDSNRARSLQTRFEDETVLLERAFERPFFGWGGYDRKGVDILNNKRSTAYDSRWIILVGSRGWVGMICRMLIALFPLYAFCKRFPPWTWHGPLLAPAGGLFMLVMLHELDALLNSMPSPITILAAGVLANLATPKDSFST